MPGPLIGVVDEARTDRIVADVLPFLVMTLGRAQHVIEKFLLPQGAGLGQPLPDPLAGLFLPELHKNRERLCVSIRCTKEVNVIWHDYVTTDSPSMAASGALPFIDRLRSRRQFRARDWQLSEKCTW
ncbi:MAG TPA: hypothetical protein VGM62_15510 [Chthoniobacterales bacterium]